jgi:uncharacterized metal-binding protein YceD (DUF177 family)
MLIDINGLKEEKKLKVSLTNKENDFKDVFKDLEGFKLDCISTDLILEKKKSTLNIKGFIKGQFKLKCVRCLNYFSFSKDFNFNIYYYLKKANIKNDLELNFEDLDTSFFKKEKIDLKELIREQVILNIPNYPICTASCSGGSIKYENKKILKKNPFSKLKDLKINK